MQEYPLVGRQLGPYHLLEGVGRGGMAEVYLAEDQRLDRKVAVKILPAALAEQENFRARFEREARAAARLQHPHILPVYDYGQQDNFTYLVMPYIADGSLAQAIANARGPLPLNKIVQWTDEMGSALQFAHNQGIIHRDVKPGNMLMGPGEHLLLSDFGIAKVMDSNTALTHTGASVGSPEYMSPEQATGEADYRSDIYSLGIVIYKMLTGQVPFSASTPVQVMFRHVQEPPPSPRTFNPAISPQIEAVVLQALAKRPEQRFQSASALASALKSAASGSGPYQTNAPIFTQPAPEPASFYPPALQTPASPTNTSQPATFASAYQPQTAYNQAAPPYPATYESTLYDPSRPHHTPGNTWANPQAGQAPPAQVYPGHNPQLPPARKGGSRILIAALAAVLVVAVVLGGVVAYVSLNHNNTTSQEKPTATTAATAGSTPTPTTIPLLYQVVNPLCDDPSLWTRNTVAANQVDCQSDGLHLSRPTNTDFTSSIFLQSYPQEPPSGFPANYRLEVDTTMAIVDPNQASSDLTGFGIIFRNQTGSGGYFFMIDPVAGDWLFKGEDAQGQPYKIGRDASSSIQTGQGAKNHLRVDVKGNMFIGYVNGVEVGSASDSSFSGGNVGLVVSFKGMTVIYTNFTIEPIS
jgi:serine/threonine protein kinase